MIERFRSKILVVIGLMMAVVGLRFSLVQPEKVINQKAQTLADAFVQQTAKLTQAAEDFKFGRASQAVLEQQLLETRLAYKRIEFLLEYFYPSFSEEHINGAPLLHIERYDTRPFVLMPEGLQVLDEQVFSDEPDAAQIQILAKKLQNHSMVLQAGFAQKAIQAGEVLEAMRAELVRIFSLGLTGFDTPGSVNALAEANASLQSLQEVGMPFLLEIEAKKAAEIKHLFTKASETLEQATDFDSFDRLGFLRDYINPLYSVLLDLRLALSPKTERIESGGRHSLSRNLFASDFLDPYFYTELTSEEDSKALRDLGKKLFYDPLLSASGKMSCATCHQAALAFSDGLSGSQSNVQGEQVLRNAPTLLNAVYADRYFYDLRAFTLEQQAEHVIFNTQEFNTAYAEIVAKLERDEAYKQLFKQALGTSNPSREGFSKALTSYVLSLRSHNSPFDRYVRGEQEHISQQVKEGFNLFMGKAACGTCHFAPTFSGLVPPLYAKNESEILGVLSKPNGWGRVLDKDMGRYENGIYSEQAWIYERSFKTVSVRNVALTAPYFHNGAYKTLEEVVDFYNNGGGAGIGLEVKNQTLPSDSLHLSEDEKRALIAFMQALSDTSALGY